MPELYFDNGIKLGHLQGSVAGVPVPRVPGLAVSEVQAPDSDSPRKCGCKGVSEDVVSALTMLVEDWTTRPRTARRPRERCSWSVRGRWPQRATFATS